MKRKRNAVPLTRVGGYWVLRPRLEVIENGERKTVQRAIKLIAADGRSKRPSQDVLDLAAEELRRLKGKPGSPIKSLRVGEFFDTVFLPRVRENLRPSTATGYANAWAWYVQPAAFARMWLREVRTCDVQDLLDGVARTHHISTTTLAHAKSLLSGVFRVAAKLGYIGKEGNPVRETSVPGFAAKPRETKAYSSEEVARMLDVLSADPLALTLTAVAAYSGLRAGEIRGLRWESYQPSDDGSLPVLKVERSIWRRFESDPKTAMSKAAVPVIPQLASLLDAWQKRCGNPNTGTIFNNVAGGDTISRNENDGTSRHGYPRERDRINVSSVPVATAKIGPRDSRAHGRLNNRSNGRGTSIGIAHRYTLNPKVRVWHVPLGVRNDQARPQQQPPRICLRTHKPKRIRDAF